MSIKKKIIIFILTVSFNIVSSQQTILNDNITVLVKPADTFISHLSADLSGMSIGVYINGFESKKKREKLMAKYKKEINGGRGVYVTPPTFSVNFLSFSKPEKLTSLDGTSYILPQELNIYKICNPTYFILTQSDGTYLKWSAVLVPIE